MWVLLLCFAGCLSTTQPADALTSFRIGTGGSTGVYYPVGKLIAAGLTASAGKNSSALAGVIGVAQNSAGSIENTRRIIAGELEAGLVQANIAASACEGEGDFSNLPEAADLRAIASLYSEKFQMVVRKDAGIGTFGDLRGKRISVDELGSGTRVIMNIVLEAYGLTENDLRPLYLKPAFTEGKMKNGEMQGFAIMAGAPNAAVTKLFDTGVTLLSIDPPVAAAISKRYRYLFPGTIDGNIYRGVPETPTLEVYALFVVSGKMPDDVAYAVTEALFGEETTRLLEGHPLGKAITLHTALRGLSIPLHPGAARFYREHQVADK